MANSIKIRAKAKGDEVTVKALMSHPMETGLRYNSRGLLIPVRIVERFTCRIGDEVAFSAELEPAIAANPYLGFSLRLEASADLSFEWVDTNGDVYPNAPELLDGLDNAFAGYGSIELGSFARKTGQEIDFGLTTRETAKMISEAGVRIVDLPPSDFDDPFGTATGSGVIFGATGGIGSATARLLHERGCALHLVARDESRLAPFAHELGAHREPRLEPAADDVAGGEAAGGMAEQLPQERAAQQLQGQAEGLLVQVLVLHHLHCRHLVDRVHAVGADEP